MTRDPLERRYRWLLLASVLGGLGLRLILAHVSIGSDDIVSWHLFASNVKSDGLLATYVRNPYFNHPPLMGYLAAGLLSLAEMTGVGFAELFKFPLILADALAAWIIWRSWVEQDTATAAAATAIFMLSPVAITISAYHGNTDSLCVALSLLAVFLLARERPTGAGLALGAAINVKLIPVILIPALIAYTRSRRMSGTKLLLGLGMAGLPFLMVIPIWSVFSGNALAYNSEIALWGVGQLFIQTREVAPEIARVLSDYYIPNGRYIIIGAVCIVAVLQTRQPRWTAPELGAICFSLFLILTPGFGIQYLVYAGTLIAASDSRWGLRFNLLAGLFAILVYYTFWTGTWPAFSHFTTHFKPPAGVAGLLAWLSLVGYSWVMLRYRHDPSLPASSGANGGNPVP